MSSDSSIEESKIPAIASAKGEDVENLLTLTSQFLPTGSVFDVKEIEEGLDAQQVADFRRAQLEGMRIARSKHENEIVANWKLGTKIDTMMCIIESKHGSTRNAKAALHCARVFGLNEKNVTDYRRFYSMFPDAKEIKQLINLGPSWSVVRNFLQYDTEDKRKEAMKWMVRDGKFISSGDLVRIQDAARAAKEQNKPVDMLEISSAVFEAREQTKAEREKAKEDKLNAKLGESGSSENVEGGDSAGPPASTAESEAAEPADAPPAKESKPSTPKERDPSDLVSTGKLVKHVENQLNDLNGNLAVVVSRMYKVNKMDDDKQHQKLVNAVEDKLLPKLQETKEQILAIEKMLKEMTVSG